MRRYRRAPTRGRCGRCRATTARRLFQIPGRSAVRFSPGERSHPNVPTSFSKPRPSIGSNTNQIGRGFPRFGPPLRSFKDLRIFARQPYDHHRPAGAQSGRHDTRGRLTDLCNAMALLPLAAGTSDTCGVRFGVAIARRFSGCGRVSPASFTTLRTVARQMLSYPSDVSASAHSLFERTVGCCTIHCEITVATS